MPQGRPARAGGAYSPTLRTPDTSPRRAGGWRPPRDTGPSPRALGTSPTGTWRADASAGTRAPPVRVHELPEAEPRIEAAAAGTSPMGLASPIGRGPRRVSDDFALFSPRTRAAMHSTSPGASERHRQLAPANDRDEVATALQDLGRASPQQRRLAMPDPEPWQYESELAAMQVRLVEKEAEADRLRKLLYAGVGKLTADARALRASSATISRKVDTMQSGVEDEVQDVEGRLLARIGEQLRVTAARHEDLGKAAMRPELAEQQAQLMALEAEKMDLESELAATGGDLAAREDELEQEKAESLRLRNANRKLRDEMEAARSAHKQAIAMKEPELERLQSIISGEIHRVLDELRQIKEVGSPASSRCRSSASPSPTLPPAAAVDARSESPAIEPVVHLSPQLHHSPKTSGNAMISAFESPPQWGKIQALAREQPELLRIPCDSDGHGMLALHLCVTRHAPLSVTRAVFENNPEAIGIKDKAHGATPVELIAEAETAAGQDSAFSITASYLRAANAMVEATRSGEMGVLEVYASLVRTVSGTPPIGWS